MGESVEVKLVAGGYTHQRTIDGIGIVESVDWGDAIALGSNDLHIVFIIENASERADVAHPDGVDCGVGEAGKFRLWSLFLEREQILIVARRLSARQQDKR